MKKIFIVLVTVLIIGFTLFTAGSADEKVAFCGVDLSRWDEETDFNKLKSRGVEFAILRAYAYHKDVYFDQYYDQSVQAGMPVGAYEYMYATTEEGAKNEANETIKVLDGRRLDYPLFLDIEDKVLKKCSKSTLTRLAKIELDIFEAAGYNVGIYCSKSFKSEYLDMTKLHGYDMWIARWTCCTEGKYYYYSSQNPVSDWNPGAEMWQFSDRGDGKYYGVSSSCLDLNYSYYDYLSHPDLKNSTNPLDYTVPVRTISYNSTTPMTGKDVSWVQSVLYQLGYRTHVNGTFSSYTKTVVEKFQQDNKLTKNGKVDSATLSALKNIANNNWGRYKIYYNSSTGQSSVYSSTVKMNSDYTISANSFSVENKDFAGWTVKRSSDKKWLCTDGKWYTSADLPASKKVFSEKQLVNLDASYISETTISDNLVFYAVWKDSFVPITTFTYKGNTYSVYSEKKTFNDAKEFCESKGGHLVTITSEAEMNAVTSKLSESTCYIGGIVDSKETTSWITGETFSYSDFETQSSSPNYKCLVLSNSTGTYKFRKDKSDTTKRAFILEVECKHSNQKTLNATSATCTKKGYSGDIYCVNCEILLAKGNEISKKAHTYGLWTLIKKATLKEDGSQKAACTVCGAEKTSAISKISSVKLLSTEYACTGKQITPTVTVLNSKGTKLKKGVDFSVTYKNNTNVGKATATIKFIGNYSLSSSLNFKIKPSQVTGLKVSSVKRTVVSLKWNSSKGTTHYKVEMSTDGKNWSKLGWTQERNCKVSDLKPGTKYQFRVTSYNKNVKYYGKVSSVVKTVTLTAAPVVTVKSSDNSKVNVSWNKVTGAKTYIVYKSSDKTNWIKAITITGNSISLRRITSGKRLYVKVVATNSNGVTGSYSKIVSA